MKHEEEGGGLKGEEDEFLAGDVFLADKGAVFLEDGRIISLGERVSVEK